MIVNVEVIRNTSLELFDVEVETFISLLVVVIFLLVMFFFLLQYVALIVVNFTLIIISSNAFFSILSFLFFYILYSFTCLFIYSLPAFRSAASFSRCAHCAPHAGYRCSSGGESLAPHLHLCTCVCVCVCVLEILCLLMFNVFLHILLDLHWLLYC